MHAGSFAVPTLSLRLLFFLSRHPTYSCACCAVCRSVRPSIHPAYPYVRPLVRRSARGTHARAAERARASVFCVGVRRFVHSMHMYTVYTHMCVCVCMCVCVYTHTHTHVYVRRESASIASLSVSEHATHDIRRWGPCGHLISGDMRARASLLIVRPLARLRSHVCQR